MVDLLPKLFMAMMFTHVVLALTVKLSEFESALSGLLWINFSGIMGIAALFPRQLHRVIRPSTGTLALLGVGAQKKVSAWQLRSLRRWSYVAVTPWRHIWHLFPWRHIWHLFPSLNAVRNSVYYLRGPRPD